MSTPTELIDEAISYLKQTTVGYANHKASWYADKTTNWWKGLDRLAQAKAALTPIVTPPPPPPPPPSSSFGAQLPARLAASSSGPVIVCTSLAELMSARSSAPLGSIITSDRPIDLQGGTFLWDRVGDPTKVTELRATVFNGGANANVRVGGSGSYFRFTGESRYGQADGVKMTDGCHHIEIGGYIHDNKRQGVLVTGSGSFRQLYNARLAKNGSTQNLDHNIYWSNALPGDLIANCIGDLPWAYNLQIYPNAVGLLVVASEFHGGQVHANSRGGIIIGCESANTTKDVTLVGIVSTDAPTSSGIDQYGSPSNIKIYDSCTFNNAGGDITDAVFTKVRCVHAASTLVDPTMYGYIPAYDIDGKPRVAGNVRAGALV